MYPFFSFLIATQYQGFLTEKAKGQAIGLLTEAHKAGTHLVRSAAKHDYQGRGLLSPSNCREPAKLINDQDHYSSAAFKDFLRDLEVQAAGIDSQIQTSFFVSHMQSPLTWFFKFSSRFKTIEDILSITTGY
jgi:hypothetical protein